jgi:hypothetical protein
LADLGRAKGPGGREAECFLTREGGALTEVEEQLRQERIARVGGDPTPTGVGRT